MIRGRHFLVVAQPELNLNQRQRNQTSTCFVNGKLECYGELSVTNCSIVTEKQFEEETGLKHGLEEPSSVPVQDATLALPEAENEEKEELM